MDREPVEFPGTYFRREDESDDPLFYREPRLVVHIDEATIEAVGEYLGDTLPPRGVVLDLMSSWRSHLPATWPKGHVTGLGMNAVELAENPQLDERIVHDLNADPTLPLPTEHFDAAVVTVSIQYMTRPLEVFAEVCRLLKPGGTFHVLFSERMFPTKAVAVWRSMPQPQQRAELIAEYFVASRGWSEPAFLDRSPRSAYADPLYVVRASRVE